MTKVRHVVLVKFPDDITKEDQERFIKKATWGKGAAYVSGFASGFGVDPNPWADSSEAWDWALTLDVDEVDVAKHATDPVHTAAGEAIAHIAERYAILDFIIEE